MSHCIYPSGQTTFIYSLLLCGSVAINLSLTQAYPKEGAAFELARCLTEVIKEGAAFELARCLTEVIKEGAAFELARCLTEVIKEGAAFELARCLTEVT